MTVYSGEKTSSTCQNCSHDMEELIWITKLLASPKPVTRQLRPLTVTKLQIVVYAARP
jgi:hypothetical protein